MPSHRVRLMSPAALAVCLAFAATKARAAEIPAPTTLAFNGGIYAGEVIDAAVMARTAEIVRANGTDVVVRHLWIESLENDPRDGRVALTVFEVCETTFSSAVGTLLSTPISSRILTAVDVKYVVLDTRGYPARHPIRVTYQRTPGGDVWTRASADLTLIDFESGLSLMARQQLRIASGLLARYPGQNVVPYAGDVELAKLTRLLGVVVTGVTTVLAPELIPAALAGVAEEEPLLALLKDVLMDVAKDLALDKLRELLAAKKARWGRDGQLGRTRLHEESDAQVFEEEGRTIWPKFQKRFDGIWESLAAAGQPDSGHRFRLEIVGARVTWTERQLTADRRELRRDLIATENRDGSLKIARPYDEDILRFQFPNRWSDVADASPVASTLTLTLDDGDLSGDYVGPLLNANGDVTMSTRSYDFVNATWKREN